jgi:methyl-accepting chemotaxis protein
METQLMKWFYNLKTTWKLLLGYAVVCAIMAGVGYVGITRLANVNAMVGTLYERDMMGLSHAKEANTILGQIGRACRQAIIVPDKKDKEVQVQKIEKQDAEFQAQLGKYEKTIVLEEARVKLEAVRR